MGEVWLARHLRWMDKPVAIKFLRSPSGDGRDVESLLAEADVMVTLLHDGIVRLFTVDRLEDQTPFLVMEYLAGPNLAEFLGHGTRQPVRLGPADALHLLSQIAPALDYAHRKGVAHRDIKPANLMLDAPVDGSLVRAHLKLADFGIAHFLDADSTVHLAGTPRYMAPECLSGPCFDVERLASADIYGLGATMYHLVAGRPPFVGSLDEVLFQQLNEPPPPVESGNRALDGAILRCLEKDAADRPTSAVEFYTEARGKAAVTVTLPEAAPGDTEESPAGDGSPLLFLQGGGSYGIDQNHVLEFGVVNTGPDAVRCWLQVDAVHPDALSVFHPERELDLAPGQGDWALVSFRAHEHGRNEVRVRVHCRSRDPVPVTRSWEVPESCLYVEIEAAGRGRAIVLPKHRVGPPRSGRARVAYDRLLAQRGGQGDDPSGSEIIGVRLARPRFACGVIGADEPAAPGSSWVLDVRREGRPLQRVRVLFRTRVSFGRTPRPPDSGSEAHLALCWLPSRSRTEDPENYDRNRAISRRTGSVECDELGTVVHSTSTTLHVDREQLLPGHSRRLLNQTPTRLALGAGPEPLELELVAFRRRRRHRELCRLLLQAPAYSTTAHPALDTAPLHPSLRIRRVSNVPRLSYVLAMPWASVGGDARDACHVTGLPPNALFVAHSGTGAYVLVASELLRGDDEPMWRPLTDDLRIVAGGFDLRFRRSDLGELALETELLGTGG